MLGLIVAALALPAPSPIPQQSGAPVCAPAPLTTADIFGTQLEDRAALRFIRKLETMTPATRAAAIAGSRMALDGTSLSAIEDAFQRTPCSESAASLAADRMATAISAGWNVSDDRDAANLTSRIELIAKTLISRALLPAQAVDSVLVPFATTRDAIDAPAPVLPASCATPNAHARIVRVMEPAYPDMAQEHGVTGRVLVKVELDEDGDVTRASIFWDDLPVFEGSPQIREASIYAAANSVYRPEIRSCAAVAGTYIFEAEFASGIGIR